MNVEDPEFLYSSVCKRWKNNTEMQLRVNTHVRAATGGTCVDLAALYQSELPNKVAVLQDIVAAVLPNPPLYGQLTGEVPSGQGVAPIEPATVPAQVPRADGTIPPAPPAPVPAVEKPVAPKPAPKAKAATAVNVAAKAAPVAEQVILDEPVLKLAMAIQKVVGEPSGLTEARVREIVAEEIKKAFKAFAG